MKFNDQYELLDWLQTDTEKTTFAARHLFSGKAVLVHVLPARDVAEESPLAELARRQLAESEAGNFSKAVLSVSEYRGAVYVVTSVFSGFPSLQAWLEHNSQNRPADPILRPSDPVPEWEPSKRKPQQEPGEFTRLFGAYGAEPAGTDKNTGSGSPAVTADKHPAGDFTKAFGTSEERVSRHDVTAPSLKPIVNKSAQRFDQSAGEATVVQNELPPPVAPAVLERERGPLPSARPSLGQPDEWKIPEVIWTPQPEPIRKLSNASADAAVGSTIQFDGAKTSRGPVSDVIPPARSDSGEEPGEFTRLFYPPKTSAKTDRETPTRTDRASPSGSPSWPPSPQFSKPVEHFEADWNAGPERAPKVQWPEGNRKDDSEYVFGPPSRPPGKPVSSEDPGEFTRIVSAGPRAPAVDAKESASPKSAPEAPAEPAASYRWLILFLAGLLLIAVLVVVYFVLTR